MVEDVPGLIAALVGLIILARVPGFVAGFAVGAWYVAPTLVPDLAGFSPLIPTLVVCVAVAWLRYRKQARGPGPKAFLPFILFFAAVFAREILGEESRTTWAAIGVAILVGLLLVTVGAYDSTRIQLLWGFVAPNAFFAASEIIRVMSGGALHSVRIAYDANPIFAAHYLGFAIFALLYLRSVGRAPLVVAAVTLPVLALGLFLTLSRGPILAFSLAFLYWVLFAQPNASKIQFARKQFVLIIGTIAAIFAFIYVEDARSSALDSASTEARAEHWATAWANIAESPLWGSGTDALYASTPPNMASPAFYPHNVFLEAWSTYGIVALSLLAFGVVGILRRSTPDGRALLIFTILCFCVSGTLSISINLWTGVALSVLIGSRESPEIHVRRHAFQAMTRPDPRLPGLA